MLFGLFLLNGLILSSWSARVPAVRDALGVTPVQLGAIAAVGAAGGIVAAALASRVLARLGGRNTLWVSTAGFVVSFALLGLGPALGIVPLVLLGILAQAVAFALGNLPLNMQSTSIERRAGRTVLPFFHGGFSVGAVLGALTGAACAAADVSLLAQFLATAVVAACWRVAAVPVVLRVDGAPTEPAEAAPKAAAASPGGLPAAGASAWRESRTVLLGVIALSGAVCEGAANDWLSLSVVDGFRSPAAMGAIVLGVFVASMTMVRFAGPWVIDRFGRVRTLRTCALAACAGLALYANAPVLPLALVGVVAWGGGIALIVPIAIAAASDEPACAARRIAVVSAFASAMGLVGSPLLGVAVQALGARHAIGLVPLVALAVALLARQVAPMPSSARVPGTVDLSAAAEAAAAPAPESHHRWLIRHRGPRRQRRRVAFLRRRSEEVGL